MNSSPCVSFMTDAEAQPLTTCEDGEDGEVVEGETC